MGSKHVSNQALKKFKPYLFYNYYYFILFFFGYPPPAYGKDESHHPGARPFDDAAFAPGGGEHARLEGNSGAQRAGSPTLHTARVAARAAKRSKESPGDEFGGNDAPFHDEHVRTAALASTGLHPRGDGYAGELAQNPKQYTCGCGRAFLHGPAFHQHTRTCRQATPEDTLQIATDRTGIKHATSSADNMGVQG